MTDSYGFSSSTGLIFSTPLQYVLTNNIDSLTFHHVQCHDEEYKVHKLTLELAFYLYFY